MSCSNEKASNKYDVTVNPDRFTVLDVVGSDKINYEVIFSWGQTLSIPGDHEIYCRIEPENKENSNSETLFHSGNRRELRNIRIEPAEGHDWLILNYAAMISELGQREVFEISLDDEGIPRLKALEISTEGSEIIYQANEWIEPDSRMVGERISPSYDKLIDIYRGQVKYMINLTTMNTEPAAPGQRR